MNDALPPTIPPRLEIVIVVEGIPSVRFWAEHDFEEDRLFDWLRSRPGLWELVCAAAAYRDGAIEGPPGAGSRMAA